MKLLDIFTPTQSFVCAPRAMAAPRALHQLAGEERGAAPSCAISCCSCHALQTAVSSCPAPAPHRVSPARVIPQWILRWAHNGTIELFNFDIKPQREKKSLKFPTLFAVGGKGGVRPSVENSTLFFKGSLKDILIA